MSPPTHRADALATPLLAPLRAARGALSAALDNSVVLLAALLLTNGLRVYYRSWLTDALFGIVLALLGWALLRDRDTRHDPERQPAPPLPDQRDAPPAAGLTEPHATQPAARDAWAHTLWTCLLHGAPRTGHRAAHRWARVGAKLKAWSSQLASWRGGWPWRRKVATPRRTRRLILTPLGFLALIAVYGFGLFQEFTAQGFRNLAAIACAAAVFLFCYARGPELARSKATVPLVVAALVALLPSYFTDVVIHAHMFAAMLGYAFLTAGIVLAARARSTRTQALLAHGALFLALVCGLIYGSRAQVLVTVLAYGFYWASQGLLKSRFGSFGLAGCAGVVVGIVVLWYASPRSDETMRRLDAWSLSYTGAVLNTGRENLFRATLAGIAESPWWGHGPGVDITDFPAKAPAELPADVAPDDPLCMSGSPPELLRDCRTLLQLRNTLAGEAPQALWHWNFNFPLSRWSGVSIAGDPPRIVGIQLVNAKLTGQIPAALAELDKLETLALDTNYLNGAIPPELGALTQLKTLSLSNNALSGEVPATLTKLSELRALDLSNNQLHGAVPAALAEITGLEELKLAGNAFSGPLPATFYSIGQHDLYEGLLCRDALRDLYPGLFEDCSALLAGRDVLAGDGALNWSRVAPINAWRGVELAGTPPRVQQLHLSDAGLNGNIPREFGALERLEVLKLDGNRLSGGVPWSLLGLDHLQEVRLGGNDLTEAPPAPLFSVPFNDLRDMLYCAHTGTIGDGLLRDCETLLGVKDMLAGEARLNWRRGEPLGQWRGVQLGGEPLRIIGLTLGNSDLGGRVPPALGNLDQLTMLYLDHNDLSGTLPTELGQLAHLRAIKLDDTLLAGGAPTALCGLAALAGTNACRRPTETNPDLRADQEALLAARAELDPGEVTNWHPDLAIEAWDGIVLSDEPLRVTGILLGGRGLAGEISPALARLNELVELRLQRNGLRGTIPPQLGQLTRLESLSLAGNALRGGIPPQLGNLKQLSALSLAGNRLTGPIVDELAALPQLAFLRLAGNDFVGDVPAGLRDVADHDIDQDLFCFPSPRGNSALLEDCRTLLAARDELAGEGQLNWRASTPIGQWQGVILGAAPSRVVALDLAKMGLTGHIPAALGRLTALRSLVLDGNALAGPIPPEVSHLKGLRTLRVAGNALSRGLPFAWSSHARSTAAVGAARPGTDGSGDGAAACSLAGPNSGLLADCRTLLAARDTLAGGTSLNWSGTLPIEAWDGLALAGVPRRVVALNLAGAGLAGRIPAALGQLSRLVTLRLDDNRLRGSVPAALGRLANLEVLRLNNNALHGTLPPALGELPRLRVVRVAGNEFSGRLPAGLRELDHDLDEALFCLPLVGVGPGLLQDCNALLVARDTLAGNGALNWRREVALGRWQGVELDGEPPRVVGLDVAELGLNGQIPAELGGLTELRRLALGGNALTGPVPDELVRLSKLETLWLFRQPSGTDGGVVSKRAAVPRFPTVGADAHVSRQSPPCTTDNPALAADCELLLDVRRTLGARLNWSRTLPVENWEGVRVGGTPQRVTGVFLGNRGLSGRIPSAFGGLDKLERFSLQANSFSGVVPPSIWHLSNLTHLNFAGNLLTGAIPDEPPQLLERVVLAGNRFTGRIPPAWVNLPKLKEIQLDGNAFTDCAVPPHKPDLKLKLPIDSLHCLPLAHWKSGLKRDAAILLAARDELAGDGELDWSRTKSIAAWQGVTLAPTEHEGIVAIDLRRTGLTGRIPTQLSGLTLLETLRLDGNQLTGPIPEELSLLPNLRELNLASNKLSGMVSPSLRMRLASGMSIADNRLTGSAAAEPPATGSVPPALATAADATRRANRSNAADRVATTVDAQGRSESSNADPRRSDLQDNNFATPFPAGLRNIADHDLPPVCPIIPRANSGLLRDCRSLLDSRDALAGTANLNWSGTIPMAAWQGVQLRGNPIRVTALVLPDAGLNGRLPAALGNLDKLTKLRLEGNRLAGPLPVQLGNLKRLQDLALAHNRLTGDIPAALGTLPHLEHLTLGGNRFSSPAPHTLRAVERNDLDLAVFCPASRSQAPGLFEDCQTLLSVRDPLAGRANLNWRRGAPLGAWAGVRLGGDPVRVEALQLPGRGLDGRVPPQLGRLSALRKLDLGGNALRGELPAALGQLTRLVELRLAGNRLSGIIPIELTALNLRLLRFAGNAFSGPVPVALRHLPNTDLNRDMHCPSVPPSNPGLSDDCGELLALRDDLAPNGQLNWSRRLPLDRWQGVVLSGSPLRVTGLHLPRQGLGGRLPAKLGNLSRLAAIDLSFNDLHGSIPPELGQLSRLQFVELRRNHLTGAIPGELGQLARLEELFLSGNQLTGHIPAALAQLSELVTLRLQGNRFLDCTAPAGLTAATVDHDLDAVPLCHPLAPRHPGLARDAATLLAVRDALAAPGALNWRIGTPIPAWEGVTLSHGMRPRVAGLELSAKSLTGRIPAALGDLDELSILHLDANALAGAVPPELGRLKRLESLKLNDNLLTGNLPQTLGGLNALKVLRLSNNLFKGLPPTALRQVQDHDLGFGPRCRSSMANAPGLQRDCNILLAVRDNLAGTTTLNWSPDAPIDMWRGVVLGGEPSRVIALHLINSGLSGSIPPRLGELDALRSLQLSRNALSGTLPATLGKLSNLSELLLGDNALSGPIPRELGRLTNLTSLRLRKNRLDGPIPTELGRLHNLRELALDDNALSGPIPRELGELSALEELWLAGNDLTAPPSAIEASPTPAVRDPARAPRTQVHPALAAPDTPPTFAASRAIAPGQPPPLGLDLFCTRDGAGTQELRRDCRSLLSALEDLSDPTLLNWHPDVPIGQWRGVGLTAQPAPRVTSVDVAGMGLHGTISRQFTALSALETLRLNDNEFSGYIPGRIGRLKALRELRLERNELTGSIPLSIENLQELKELRLNDNALTGHLEPLKSLGKLSTMRLGGNDFLGCLPERLRGVGDHLVEMDVECGATPWSQPPLFADAAALMASRDTLADGASLDWGYDTPVRDWQGVTVDGSPPRVVALDLEGAGLAGRVPAELGVLSALTRLDLNGNALSGSLPAELGQLAHLRTLSVTGNKLAGELPMALDYLYHLEQLELAGNDFLGCPPELVRYRVRSALLPLTLRHCPTTWEYQTTEQIGGTLNSINNLVDRGAEQHLAEGAHNLFLQMGLQTGLVGVGALGLLCMSLIFNLRSRPGRKVTPVQCLAVAGTAMAITHSAFDIFLLQYVMTVAVFVWMFLGIGTGLAHKQPEGEAEQHGKP